MSETADRQKEKQKILTMTLEAIRILISIYPQLIEIYQQTINKKESELSELHHQLEIYAENNPACDEARKIRVKILEIRQIIEEQKSELDEKQKLLDSNQKELERIELDLKSS